MYIEQYKFSARYEFSLISKECYQHLYTQCRPLERFSERGYGSASLMRTVLDGKTFFSKHHHRSALSTSLSVAVPNLNPLDLTSMCALAACVRACMHVRPSNSGAVPSSSPKCRPRSLKASVSVCSSFRQQPAARPKFQPSGDRHQKS